MHRSEFLAELMGQKECTVAVAGAHGKTSTTALVVWILRYVGLDPTAVIGGIACNFSSNMCKGKGDIFVAEADESDRSFLRYRPSIAVVTNIDTDHMDTYKDLDDVEQTFLQFLRNVASEGLVVACSDNASVRKVVSKVESRTVTYGFDKRYKPNICAQNIVEKEFGSDFDIVVDGRLYGFIHLPVPGNYSILNALGAIAVALECGLEFERIADALKTFCGVERRFEFKGVFNGAKIFDDYAHHPVEMVKALLVARKMSRKKLFVAFQPHRYTRTQRLWTEFVDFFVNTVADQVFVFDIYSSSESPIKNISSKKLVGEIATKIGSSRIEYLSSFSESVEVLSKGLGDGDLLLTLGAGDAYKIGEALAQKA